MKKVIDYLKRLDFSEQEVKLYLILLKAGSMTVAELANKAHINRTAAYTYINSLLKKGVISQSKGSISKFHAHPPAQLHYLVDEKVSSVNVLKEELSPVVTMLNATFMQSKTETDSEIQYYRGKNGVNTIYQDCLRSLDIRTYFDAEDVDRVFPENTMKANRSVLKNPRQIIREIVRKTPTATADINLAKKLGAKNHIYKFFPEDLPLTANDILIYDSKVAIINTRDLNNVTGVVLYNRDYYNNSVQIFDLLWRLLPDN